MLCTDHVDNWTHDKMKLSKQKSIIIIIIIIITIMIINSNWTEWSAIEGVIITISKFSNLIGHQQP